MSPLPRLALVVPLALAALPAAAGRLDCTATTQCRGDAERMCAQSRLSIEINDPGAPRARLWIDRQGPYSARRSTREGATRWTLDAFGGAYRLDLFPDGRFLYRGNRGKAYTGQCAGAY